METGPFEGHNCKFAVQRNLGIVPIAAVAVHVEFVAKAYTSILVRIGFSLLVVNYLRRAVIAVT